MPSKLFFLLVLCVLFSSAIEATTYYGQVLIKNTPVQSLEVTAEWIDEKGFYHATKTRTLTESQAKKRGDSKFLGYYFFEMGNVYPKQNTNVVFSFGNYPFSLVVTAVPNQNIVKLDTISFQYVSGFSNQSYSINSTDENEKRSTLTIDEITTIIMSNASSPVPVLANEAIIKEESGGTTPEEFIPQIINVSEPINQKVEEKKPAFVKDILIFLGVIGLLGIVFFIAYLFIKQSTIYLDNAIEEFGPGHQRVRKILDTKIKNVVNNAAFCSPNDLMSSAVSQITDSGDNCAVILRNGEYYGYIKAIDLITYQGGYDKKIADAGDIIHKDGIVIDAKNTIEEAYSMMDNMGITRLAVKEGNEIIGQISALDILKLFSGIKLAVIKNKQGMPIIRDILNKECQSVEKETRVGKIGEIISKHNSEIVLITDGKYIGEITLNDFILGTIKYGQKFKENKAAQIMSTIHSIDPDSDIFDANDYIIERGFAAYPVIINDTLLGIIRPLELLGQMIKYVKNK